MADLGDLSGRLALVTGAAGNIGRAVARSLAEHGADLVLADLPAAAAGIDDTRAACARVRPDVRIDVATFDVREPEAIVGELTDAAGRLGTPTVVVNNAGYQGRFANVLDYDLDDLRSVIEVNTIGVFAVLQASARSMRAAGLGGAIVNVASMAAHGAANMPAYSTSKAAVHGLTRAAAKDLAPFGIRVNSVSPGFIGPGAMWERQVAEQAATPSQYYADDPETVARQMIDMVPLRRYGSLDEVANTVLFLASEASSFITGTDLQLSGGSA
ncbi:MAG: SDR family NAD(P)-dependent oxidoreductase [Ilumatobacteraceae bacterium]